VSKLEQWEAFELEWIAALNEYGLEYFHMTDFASRKKQYKSWNDKEREDRYSKLVDIINSRVVCSVAVVVPRLEYAAAMKKNWKVIPSQGYGFATLFMMYLVASKLEQNHDKQPEIAYVLDKDYGSGKITEFVGRATKKRDNAKLLDFLSIKRDDSHRFVPLQAADILAYQVYRFNKQLNRSMGYIRYSKHLDMLKMDSSYWVRLNEAIIRRIWVGSRFERLDLLRERGIDGLEVL
jgi:hypothetical protein